MNQAYPIVTRRYLDQPPNRGLFGWGKKSRDDGDVPKMHAHEVLVYRVDGQYIVDDGRLGKHDDQIVRASNVTLVDTSGDVPVMVQLNIPSAEASDFTVQATFACTVTDAARVVRENLTASVAILTYIKKHQRIFHLGLPHTMRDIASIRREVVAQIRAYTEIKPPDLPGMRVTLASVEVLTPKELAAFEEERRKKLRAHQLATEEQGYSQDLEENKERHSQEMSDRRRRHQHEADREDRDQNRLNDIQDLHHRHRIKHEEAEFARREVDLAVEAIGGDPYRALLYAHSNGEIDARDLAERMVADRAKADEVLRAEIERKRDDERRELDWNRDGQSRREREAREDSLRREREAREDMLRHEREAREDQKDRLAINVDLLRDLAKRGHFDMLNVNLERLIAEVSGVQTSEITNSGRHEQLPASGRHQLVESRAADDRGTTDSDGTSDELDPIDVEVREEDD